MTKEEMKFITGNEQDFINFIDNLKESDKIALLSHWDLDGIASAKIFEEIIKPKLLKLIDYKEFNDELLKELSKKEINKVIILDIATNSIGNNLFKKLEEINDKILIIDHHEFEKDLNSKKIIFINQKDYCVGFLSYYLVSKIKNIEYLDWLIACCSISDFAYFKNKKWMKEVYKKYGEKFDYSETGIKKSKFWDIQNKISYSALYFKNILGVYKSINENFGEIGELDKACKIIKKEVDKQIEEFYNKKQSINIGGSLAYFYEVKSKYPIMSIVNNVLSMKEKSQIFILIQQDKKIYKISTRNQSKEIDLPEFLKKLIMGFKNSGCGGHFSAAGGFFPVKYLKTFEDRLLNIQH